MRIKISPNNGHLLLISSHYILHSFGKSSPVFPGASPFFILCLYGLWEWIVPPGLDVSMLPNQGP